MFEIYIPMSSQTDARKLKTDVRDTTADRHSRKLQYAGRGRMKGEMLQKTENPRYLIHKNFIGRFRRCRVGLFGNQLKRARIRDDLARKTQSS